MNRLFIAKKHLKIVIILFEQSLYLHLSMYLNNTFQIVGRIQPNSIHHFIKTLNADFHRLPYLRSVHSFTHGENKGA